MSDIAVIGGGVIGLSCARELARSGASVTLLEALPAVGHGSSARANGGFRAQFTTPANIAFSLASIPELVALERSNGGLALHQTGYLLIAGTEEGERALRAAYELQRAMGAPTIWLAPNEVTSPRRSSVPTASAPARSAPWTGSSIPPASSRRSCTKPGRPARDPHRRAGDRRFRTRPRPRAR